MDKGIISTKDAPEAIGPYSQAIKSNGFIFTSGQIPIDPATGEMVSGGIEIQTEQVMKNLAGVLNAASKTFSDVVKATVFLTDLNDFQTVNSIYAKYFEQEPPARSCVQVAALPRGAKIEIEVIVV